MNKTNLLFSVILVMSGMFITGCDREIDDLIKEPTETSFTIFGTIKACDGSSLSNIPVSVDYVERCLTGTLTKHKAKGLTDSSGCYQLFFEFDPDKENIGLTTLTIDFDGLSSEKYLIPFTDSKFESVVYLRGDVERSMVCNLTIPNRKDIKTMVFNNGLPLENGDYFIKNTFVYGFQNVDYDHSGKSIEISQFTIIPMRPDGFSVVTIPAAEGINNQIGLVFRGSHEGVFYGAGIPYSEVKEIKITESFKEDILLDYILPKQN